MTREDENKIKAIAEGHTTAPSTDVWDRIDTKLKAKENRSMIINYRNMSVAAIMIAILSVTIVFRHYLKDHNPYVFASNEHYVPLVIEELDTDISDVFYSTDNISHLRSAYEKAGF